MSDGHKNPMVSFLVMKNFSSSLPNLISLCLMAVQFFYLLPFFCLSHLINWPPGGSWQTRPMPPLRLYQNMLPTKFRPILLTFGATCIKKTNERRGTPQRKLDHFTTMYGGFAPLGRGHFATSFLYTNRPEKGNHFAPLGG